MTWHRLHASLQLDAQDGNLCPVTGAFFEVYMPTFVPVVNGKADNTRTITVSEEHANQVLRPQNKAWKEVFDEKPKEEVEIPQFQKEVLKVEKQRGRPAKNRI